VKTAVSLPAEVFEQVEAAAQEMGVARSQVVTLALERFLARRRNERLREEINAAYADSPNEEERRLLEGWRQQYGARMASQE
jgi:metal-responsive CopG/Arc/MetJ family transcriptional regulator